MVRKQDGRLGRQQGVLNDGPHSLAELADARRRMVAELPDPQLGVFVVSFQREQLDANDPAVNEQLESLSSLKVAVVDGRDSFLTLADIMDGLPRLERRFNREVVRASEGIRVMASNLDRTIASISRALRDQA